jgi:hypothetical protein
VRPQDAWRFACQHASIRSVQTYLPTSLRLEEIASSSPEALRFRHPFQLRRGAGGEALQPHPQLPVGNVENTFSMFERFSA